MGKTRRGRRRNPNCVAPPVAPRPLPVPIFRFIEPEDEAVTNTAGSDTFYRADGESVGTRRMASGAGKNLQFRGQREGVDDIIAKNESRLMILQRRLFATPPTSMVRAEVRREVSVVRELLDRLYQIKETDNNGRR